MAIYNYIGWAANTNKIILDSTTIKVGQNALKSDELENGSRRSRRRGLYVPKVYSVTMEFDWIKEDANGKTEYQRFLDWYENDHQYGVIPFQFPQILLSPNTGIKIYDLSETPQKVEYYKITSELDCNRSGECMQVKMTWESVYSGTVNYSTEEKSIDSILNCKSTYIDINFSNIGNTEPVVTDFILYINSTKSDISGFLVNGTIVRVFYTSQSIGTEVTFAYDDGMVTVPKGTFKGEVA